MLEWKDEIVFSVTFTSQNWAFWVMKVLVNLIQKFRLRNLWRKGLQFLLLLFLDLDLLLIKLLLFYSRFRPDEGKKKGHRRSYMTSAIDIWHWLSLWGKQPKCSLSLLGVLLWVQLSPQVTIETTLITPSSGDKLSSSLFIYFLNFLQLVFWGESRPIAFSWGHIVKAGHLLGMGSSQDVCNMAAFIGIKEGIFVPSIL